MFLITSSFVASFYNEIICCATVMLIWNLHSSHYTYVYIIPRVRIGNEPKIIDCLLLRLLYDRGFRSLIFPDLPMSPSWEGIFLHQVFADLIALLWSMLLQNEENKNIWFGPNVLSFCVPYILIYRPVFILDGRILFATGWAGLPATIRSGLHSERNSCLRFSLDRSMSYGAVRWTRKKQVPVKK